MANTTNFGWETPDDTDLVKDGAAAMRTLGSAIDTSMMDLKGGTTGQVLSKNSNTDMDFVWVTSDDANAIQNAIVDAKGDLISATAADTPARLAVGTNNQVLMADSAQSTGLKYANEATATLTAKGDILTATAANTLARLAVGTNDFVLTADSSTATGLKWAAAGGGSASWTTWTPSWTNLTVGNATVTARYLNSNKVCYFGIKLVFGSTTSVSGRPTFTLPVTAASQAAAELAVGFSAIQDDGVGNWLTDLYPNAATTTTMGIIPYKANDTYVKFDANISSTVPFTWATNDVIWVQGYYEVA